MQYTGSSLGQSLMSLFGFILWPKSEEPVVSGLSPRPTHFKSTLPDVFLDRIVLPLFAVAGRNLPRFRIMQQGQTHLYLLYIIVTVIVLLVWGGHP